MKKLVKVSPELAKEILDSYSETKVVIIDSGLKTVKWINLNNMTTFAEKHYNGRTFDIENIQFYILTENQPLFNKSYNSYAIWNGSAWEDKKISGAYFYSIEKANNNGYNLI